MKYPEEYELMAIFECEPKMLDNSEVPFFYNESSYSYKNAENQVFNIVICPAYKEFKLVAHKDTKKLASLILKSIETLSILKDDKTEKKIMLISDNYSIKLTLKPELNIEFEELNEF